MSRFAPIRLAALAAALLSVPLALAPAPAAAQAIPKDEAKAKAKATKSTAKVNLNTATADELQELTGVGPATAEKIIAGRPYASVDDLGRAGLSARLIDSLRPDVTTGRAAAAKKATTPKPAADAPAPAAGTAAKAKKTTVPADEAKAKAKTTAKAKAPTGAPAAPAGAPVNLNTADAEALQTLPRIGPATARAIIAGRPYATVDELEKVKGLGPARIDALRPLVTVGASTAAITPAGAAPRTPRTPAEPKTPAAAAGSVVNVNAADAEALQTLPGVGPAIAESIIAGRPYKSLEDLQEVKGLGEAKVAALKGRVSFGRPAAAPAPSTAAAPAPRTAPASDDLAIVVNVNTADAEALQTLPGVGPAIAESIIAGRPYKTLEDLQNVKGLGEVKVAALKDRVSFGPAARAPRGESPGTPTTRKPVEVEDDLGPIRAEFGQKINLNTATGEELETLLGIGPVRAQAIIDGRPFAAIEDVMNVKGIKEKTFAKIKDFIRVK